MALSARPRRLISQHTSVYIVCALPLFLQDYQLRKLQRKKEYETWLAQQPYDDETA